MIARDRTAGLLLVAAILFMVVLAPDGAGAAPKTGTDPAVTRVISIPPGAFGPERTAVDFVNEGTWLALATGAGPGTFVADVPLPPGVITIHRVTLYALDDGGNSACVTMHRTNIANGADDEMVAVCSDGSDPAVRPFSNPDVSPRRILDRQGAVLMLSLDGPGFLTFYGVRIVYS